MQIVPAKSAKLHTFRRLDVERLLAGDIILTTTNAPISRGIRLATRSDISHAMIYVQGHSVIDATDEGVHARNTQRLFFEADCAVHALRPTTPLTPDQAQAICFHARGKIGSQYSIPQAVQCVLPIRAPADRKQFCSRLAAQAYASAGIHIVADPDFCSPQDLLVSPLLTPIADATEPVESDEVARWASHSDLTALMRQTTNRVLDGARKLQPSIQTFDDLDAFLVASPEHDSTIEALYRESGYLDVWRVELQRNPWHYDLALMAATHEAGGVDDYCLDTLMDDLVTPNRFQANRQGYRDLHDQYGLLTFGLKHGLYETLTQLHDLRIDTAREWLHRPDRTQALFAQTPTPHSEAWFTAMEARDPKHAAIARMVTSMAGCLEVCSICGDDPANDVRLVEAGVAPSSALTLKLCDDCVGIRAGVGEIFVPMTAT